jgi:trimethylamine--corrinoid protein Co-methyltransferase
MKDRIQKIYNHGLTILEKVGIKLKHSETLTLLKENDIRVEEDIAFFTREQIELWISKAPESFTLHARNPLHNSIIGGKQTNFIPGYGCPTIYELNGTSRNALLKDYIQVAKLVHQCNHFSINGGILAQPNDVPAELSHLVMIYSALLTSDKCLMGIPGNEIQIKQIMDMVAIMSGGRESLQKNPRILTLINTISPLLMDEMALNSIKVCAQFNQPMIMSPSPAAGTTGPIDLAANLAMATAEALAAIAIAQMIRPGVPVIFGVQGNMANLKTGGISIGSPAYALQGKYTAALAKMLTLPSRCGGAATDALCVSPQSGYESMLSMLTACQNNVNLIIHSTGILDSFAAISYEKFIMDIEMLDMVKFYVNDLEVSDATLNMDLIKEVGPGGQFLTSMDTMKKCRSHSWNPKVGVRGYINPGKALEQYYKNIDNTLKQMLGDYTKPDIDANIKNELDTFIRDQGVSSQILSSVNDLINNDLVNNNMEKI